MTWRLVLLAPLAILLVLFGLSNRETVTLTLWPFDLGLRAPLSVAVLLISALAFLLGAVIAWTSSLPYRRRARQMEDSARLLSAELAEIKGRLAKDVGTALPPPR